jgi:hypothetical protein
MGPEGGSGGGTGCCKGTITQRKTIGVEATFFRTSDFKEKSAGAVFSI